MPVILSNPDVDSVVIVDDYCILYNGVAYIKPSEKDASQTERKRKRSLYMMRYRAENKQKKLQNIPMSFPKNNKTNKFFLIQIIVNVRVVSFNV